MRVNRSYIRARCLGLGDARIIVETLIVSYILEGGRIVFLGGIIK
jgi:hypothetical protein